MHQEIQAIILECCKHLAIEVERVEYVDDAVHPLYRIAAKDAKKLIGAHGESLRALNFLVKRIVEKQLGEEHLHFSIDVNNYQQDKIDEIRRRVSILAERARAFKSSAQLPEMNAYERMIVHSIIADDPELETESLGEGRLKTVVIRYRQSFAEDTASSEVSPSARRGSDAL